MTMESQHGIRERSDYACEGIAMQPMRDDPILRVEWRDAESLLVNNWNPNVVFDAELKLLERSILKTGFVQPILIAGDGTIIDGFHRAMLSRVSTALKSRYGGKVPCAVLNVDRAQAMMLTVRMNRAKGSHVAARMSEIVRELIDDAAAAVARAKVLPMSLSVDWHVVDSATGEVVRRMGEP